jgi:hypothetical protein
MRKQQAVLKTKVSNVHLTCQTNFHVAIRKKKSKTLCVKPATRMLKG